MSTWNMHVYMKHLLVFSCCPLEWFEINMFNWNISGTLGAHGWVRHMRSVGLGLLDKLFGIGIKGRTHRLLREKTWGWSPGMRGRGHRQKHRQGRGEQRGAHWWMLTGVGPIETFIQTLIMLQVKYPCFIDEKKWVSGLEGKRERDRETERGREEEWAG